MRALLRMCCTKLRVLLWDEATWAPEQAITSRFLTYFTFAVAIGSKRSKVIQEEHIPRIPSRSAKMRNLVGSHGDSFNRDEQPKDWLQISDAPTREG